MYKQKLTHHVFNEVILNKNFFRDMRKLNNKLFFFEAWKFVLIKNIFNYFMCFLINFNSSIMK